MRMADQHKTCDALVVGAGFAGLYSVHRLRSMGLNVQGIEAAPDVGGVWFWNRYPGARCDVESMQYSFGFDDGLQQDWVWTERFAAQPEILRYLNHVADRFDLRPDFRFGTRVTAARHDAARGLWEVATDSGDRWTARFLIMASGSLSVPRLPDIPGIHDFAGRVLHTGAWPDAPVDLRGLRVGVIGTGSSGVQAIPRIATDAAHVTVFQRTPNFVIPARNTPLDDATQNHWKDRYPEYRDRARYVGTFYEFSDRPALSVTAAEREAEYARRWAEGGVNFVHAFNDIFTDEAANATAAAFVHTRIREIVKDPDTAEALCPKDHPLGTKRICVGTEYYETYNRPNVTLIDLRADPIDRIEADAVVTAQGRHRIDVLVSATGYDALTGALTAIDIAGRDGLRLAAKWAAGPMNYLGLMTADFPNMFVITGPGSPSVLVNMVVGIEQHVEWIADCIAWLDAQGIRTIEADPGAERAWIDHVNEAADKTLFVKANSWYIGANIPGKPRVFLPYAGGIGAYRRRCDAVAASGYEGFLLDGAAHPQAARA
jgi:cyclohexanone monooxygenase